jgi:hypothetical protein
LFLQTSPPTGSFRTIVSPHHLPLENEPFNGHYTLYYSGSLRALDFSKNAYHFPPFDLLFSSTLKMEAAGSYKMLAVTN